MRQAITTRYAGPTDSKGGRIVTRSQAGTIVVPWDHALDVEANHTRAARFHAWRRGWAGKWFGGGTPDGYGYTFVMADPHPDFRLDPVECQNKCPPWEVSNE